MLLLGERFTLGSVSWPPPKIGKPIMRTHLPVRCFGMSLNIKEAPTMPPSFFHFFFFHLLQGYEDAFELRMVPQDLVVYQRHFQACVDNSLDCSDVLFIMRALGQVSHSCLFSHTAYLRITFSYAQLCWRLSGCD